ncbi:serine hydrolase domain-containing protein [Mycobacteroides abscessus]|uniref:serine hydrolase domain-containing protein n=1 Tax=Mycobacteroides abscessus TaxID=36809 RepID=UPI000C26A3D3|nr:serine hydrolase domain-containing protein [Mycobacteroides abscessus]
MKLDDNTTVIKEAVAAGTLGGAVVLTWQHGEIIQFDTIGWRDIEAEMPMTRDTIFRLSSMGKVITVAATFMLAEDGILSLDSPILEWAPEFDSVEVLSDPANLQSTVPLARAITIRDLLTHRSGYAYYFNSMGLLKKAYSELPFDSPDEFLASLARLPLLHQPGEKMTYGHSIDILGLVISRAAGKPLNELLHERIFGPLGMINTGFAVAPEDQHRIARLYRPRPGKLQANRRPVPTNTPRLCLAGEGLFSTADDFLRFIRMLMGFGEVDGVRLLLPESVQLMRTNTLSDAEQQVPFMGMPLWIGRGFGMGLFVVTDPSMHRLFAWPAGPDAMGWVGGYGTCWQADPSRDLILIYLAQDERAIGTISESGTITAEWWEDLMAVPFGCVMRSYAAITHGEV